ncbi:CheR family methyltransferase [Pseudoprimorskyibacter insulae]|nr:protein-glutamate O-methyltransferase CheR [Pseudoprimorskyibacter insulae]
MLAALTTNVTSFFREAHHFRILAEQVFANRPSKAPPIKIWSAGCSTGAEPVSAAITWLENGGTLDGLRILGTDIDHKILRKAGLGEYSKSEVANLSPDRLEKFFSQTKHGNFKTSHAVQSLMTFRSLNLNEPFPFSGKFDAIFCRNVAIYFDEPTQARLWDKLSDCLMPGGVLFIGHSERLDPKTSSKLKNIGITAYQRHINGE